MNKQIMQLLGFAAVICLGVFIAYKMVNIPKQAEFVAIIALFFLYPIFKNPIIGLYAIFIIGPFIPFGRRLYYLVYGRPGLDPLIMLTDVLVATVCLGMFFELRNRFKNQQTQATKYAGLIAAYIGYLVLRTFILNINHVSDSIAKLKYYAPSVLLFFIGIVLAKKFSHIKTIWRLTLAIGIAAALYGLKQLYFGYSLSEKIWFSSISFTTLFIKGIARPFSFFQAPAAFADYLVIGLIAIMLFMEWGKIKSKLLCVALIPLFIYGILITSVRSNWIGAVCVFLFWIVFVNIKKNTHRIALIVLAVSVFFIYQVMDDILTTGNSLQSIGAVVSPQNTDNGYVDLLVTSRTSAVTNPFEEHSLLSRLGLWKFLLSSSFEPQNALFGRGLGTLNADSIYFTYLAEFGYPGLFFILFLTIAFIVSGFTKLETVRDQRTKVLVKGILVLNMVMAVMNITGSHIHSFPGDVYFWFFNGVLMNIDELDAHLTSSKSVL